MLYDAASQPWKKKKARNAKWLQALLLVELEGLEPLTCALRTHRSPI